MVRLTGPPSHPGSCTHSKRSIHVQLKHSQIVTVERRGPQRGRSTRRLAFTGVGVTGAQPRSGSGQKDMTSELLERVFTLALTTRLKQHAGIHVDVRSTAWGLMEGKFGGLTVRGHRWRTPLELTAEQLMVDVGELALDYPKLVWQQTVALKNVPQGSVSFTLSSGDLANFVVHPIMMGAASRAVQGHAFLFDRTSALIRLDPATGRGVVTFRGVWAADGQTYAVTMTTPPPPSRPSTPAAPAGNTTGTTGAEGAGAAAAGGSTANPTAPSGSATNTPEQLLVAARRLPPPATRSTTGSFASLGSLDEPLSAASSAVSTPAATAPMSAAAAVVAATVAVATLAAPVSGVPDVGPAGAALSVASGEEETEAEEGEAAVAEGLRRFFSSLTLNLQGIEMRQPSLQVQAALPGPGGAAAAGVRGPGASDDGGSCGLVPALLTITMKVSIVQLPPIDMKF